MGLPTEYLGETDAKRVARLHIFRIIQQVDIYNPLPKGRIVTLAGPAPGDIGCFRTMLKAKPEQVLFVENDPKHQVGLTKVGEQWPGVSVFSGDVADVFKKESKPVSLFYADFMGVMKEEELEVFRLLSPRLRDGSVVIYTFFRGREKRSNIVGATFDPGDDPQMMDDKRFHLYMTLIREALGEKGIRLIYALKYNAQADFKSPRHAAMGVLVFKKSKSFNLGPFSKTAEEEEDLLWDAPNIVGIGRTKEMMTEAVRYLFWKGYTNKQVAEIMNVDIKRIGAWRANETRGTYQPS